jgi:hypothetical protein
MESTIVAAFLFGAVAVALVAQAWVSWLEHQRRSKALDVIKAAIEAGREPPQQLFDQLEPEPYANLGLSKRPWGEGVLFATLAIGFWVASGLADAGDQRDKFMLVAAVMSAAAAGCFALAIFRPGQRKHDDRR